MTLSEKENFFAKNARDLSKAEIWSRQKYKQKEGRTKNSKNVTLLDYQILLSVLEKIEQSLKNVLLP